MVEQKKEDKNENNIKNWIISIFLAALMFAGLQVYSASSLKFVQVSDVHFYTGEDNTTFKLRAESPKLLDDTIEQINSTPHVSFVMFTGDLIDKPFEKELQAFLPHAQKLDYPWYFTFGNHDTCVGGYLTESLFIQLVKKSNPNFTFDKPYYSFTPQKGYKVIVPDSAIHDRITANGEIDEEQLAWLENEIKSAPKDVILIFMHHPIAEPFASPDHRLLNAKEVERVLMKYKNPVGVFTGHYHASKIIQKDNILYVNSPALVSYPLAFRTVNITTFHDRVIFDFKWNETGLKNLQKLAKLMVFGTTIYTGEEKDQNGMYVIKK
jgi:3',5'-cyclic AMP phosphodiesterase CpdA